MGIVPFKRRVGVPTDTGNRPIADVGAPIAQALGQAGHELQVSAQKNLEKEQSAIIFDIENKVQNKSRVQLEDDSLNRLGKSALKDEVNGVEGVYDTYVNEIDPFVDEAITQQVDPKFQQVARERIGQTTGRYKDRFAGFQFDQTVAYRAEQTADALTLRKNEVKNDFAAGVGTIASVKEAMADGAITLTAGSGGRSTVQASLAYNNALVEESITQAAAVNPELAREMLADKELKKTLDPKQTEALGNFIDTKEEDLLVEENINRIIGPAGGETPFTYDRQLEVAQDINDTDVRGRVVSEINNRENLNQRIEATRVNETLENYYERVFVQETPTSTTQIDNDPNLTGQSKAKLMIKSWLEKGQKGAGHFSENARFISFQNAMNNIVTGEWDERDIMNGVMPKEGAPTIDIRDGNRLIAEAKQFKQTGGNSYSGASKTYQALYPASYSNQEERSQVLYGVMQDVQSFRKAHNGTEPAQEDLEKFIKFNAQGIVESSWFNDPVDVDEAQIQFPTLTEAQGSEAVKREAIDLIDKQILDFQLNGVRFVTKNPDGTKTKKQVKFPLTQFIKATDEDEEYYLLGEPETPDGNVYFYTRKNKTLKMPLEKYLDIISK